MQGDINGFGIVDRDAAEVVKALDGIRVAEISLETKVKAGLRIPDFVASILSSDRIENLP